MGQRFIGELELELRGRSAQGEGVKSLHSGLGVHGLVTLDPRGKRPRHLVHERVVHEEEGLGRDDRLAARPDDRAGIGPVENAAKIR